MDPIIMRPIGKIRSPYKETGDIPIQGKFNDAAEAWIELEDRYAGGLKDLDGFSHAFLLYYFHKSKIEKIEGKPFLEDETHGIFAIRSPNRPNHIGLSIVRIKSIQGNRMVFTEADMLDETPLLDIKPYVRHFDSRENVVCGWLEKHFKSGNIPRGTVAAGREKS
ncbi:MAG: tRNA (N6-threonylcarbamoyladenosine(37)-N6)-methyltransferase TrmO [Thermodesulfobacteriota bacterium]|nr:tRNA (N6-threonylcarbamoyladenosine(37)-N6)-methyltransferase TrmO [Thermodesulfobacteriota bacterium]